jgi:hypothetical protein
MAAHTSRSPTQQCIGARPCCCCKSSSCCCQNLPLLLLLLLLCLVPLLSTAVHILRCGLPPSRALPVKAMLL